MQFKFLFPAEHFMFNFALIENRLLELVKAISSFSEIQLILEKENQNKKR